MCLRSVGNGEVSWLSVQVLRTSMFTSYFVSKNEDLCQLNESKSHALEVRKFMDSGLKKEIML